MGGRRDSKRGKKRERKLSHYNKGIIHIGSWYVMYVKCTEASTTTAALTERESYTIQFSIGKRDRKVPLGCHGLEGNGEKERKKKEKLSFGRMTMTTEEDKRSRYNSSHTYTRLQGDIQYFSLTGLGGVCVRGGWKGKLRNKIF